MTDLATWFRRRGVGGGFVLVCSVFPVLGVFTVSRIFYLRDLSFAFWPLHLWARSTLLSGESLLWDPHLGFGQSVIADPLKHVLFPPVLLLRLLLPDVIGFNLSVALPFPIIALGAYRLFRERASRPGAALGAVVVAASGPIASTGNFLNVSWSMACVPWILFAIVRLGVGLTYKRFVLLASLFCLQFLAGEPVTLLSTGALGVAFSLFVASGDQSSVRTRVRMLLATLGAGATGVLLASAQVFPLIEATRHSARSGVGTISGSIWALHPLTLFEVVMPQVYGDPIWSGGSTDPWIGALNGGQLPYLYSIYIGVAALCLSAFGAGQTTNRRWRLFWLAVAPIFALLALGSYTPVYPLLQRYVPFVGLFRSPSKFFLFVPIPVGALCAVAWDAWTTRADCQRGLRAGFAMGRSLAILSLVAICVGLIAPSATEVLLANLAYAMGIDSMDAAAKTLYTSGFNGVVRLFTMSAISATLLWLGCTARPEAARARWVFYFLVVGDMIGTTWWVNPTMDVGQMRQPAWVAQTKDHADDRIYVAGRLSQVGADQFDIDLPQSVSSPAEPVPQAELSARACTTLATYPSAWRLRDSFSVDNSGLWSGEYYAMLRYFASSTAAYRERLLSRVGVRYYLIGRKPVHEAVHLATVGQQDAFGLYESPPIVGRVAVAPDARVESDRFNQLALLISPDFDPTSEVLLQEPPPTPTGARGAPLPAHARIVEEHSTRVVVEADVPEQGGYLLLVDSYDPNWVAEVDGAPAPVRRANVMFRSVRLSPGRHTVTFSYRPMSFYAGCILSIITGTGLLLVPLFNRRRRI